MYDCVKLDDRITYELRDLYQKYGYAQFKMSKFEPYDLYMQNKEFLVSDGIITFTDTDGTLMALKPDVTLSIVKNYREAASLQKVCYNENVYRISGASKTYREILQSGLECMGDVGIYEICEVLLLAAKSLAVISDSYVLEISCMDLIDEILLNLNLNEGQTAAIYRCLIDKNEDGLRQIVTENAAEPLIRLMRVSGPIADTIDQLKEIVGEQPIITLKTLESLFQQAGLNDHIHLDFSIISDRHYYNGIVFRGYVEGIPSEILSGGQYDRLMDRLNKNAKGIGFALYLDQLELLDQRKREYDTNTVILYDDNSNPLILTKIADEYSEQGVLLLKKLPKQLRYRRLLQYENGRLIEIEHNG